MSREIWLGLARHVLTILGGMMVSRGYMDASAVDTVVGAAVTIGGVAWSVSDKKKR